MAYTPRPQGKLPASCERFVFGLMNIGLHKKKRAHEHTLCTHWLVFGGLLTSVQHWQFGSAALSLAAASLAGANSKYPLLRSTQLFSLTPGVTLCQHATGPLASTTTGVQGDSAREKGHLHHSGGHLPDRRYLPHGVLLRGAGGELYVSAVNMSTRIYTPVFASGAPGPSIPGCSIAHSTLVVFPYNVLHSEPT